MKRSLTILLLAASINLMGQMSYFPSTPVAKYTLAPETEISLNIGQFDNPKPVARMTWWERNRLPLGVMVVQLASISLEATGDALYDMGKANTDPKRLAQMRWGHVLQGSSAIVMAGGTLALTKWGLTWRHLPWFTAEYVFWRYATFDLNYNAVAGLDPLYVGVTSTDGNILSKMQPMDRAVTKIWSVGVAFSINWSQIGWLGYKL